MRTIAIILCMLLIALPVWAGTLRDDFEDGNLEGWIETFGNLPMGSVWKVQDGVLIGRRASGWAVHLTVGDDDATWCDYTIECDMRITEKILNEWGGSLHYAGCTGRFRPDENRLTKDVAWFALNLKAAPTVWKGVIIHPDQWLIDVQAPFDAGLGIWYHLRSVMKEDVFDFYIDSILVASFKSEAIPNGRVGILAGGCTAEFDNVVITGPDVPDAGPSGFAISSAGKLATTWAQVRRVE